MDGGSISKWGEILDMGCADSMTILMEILVNDERDKEVFMGRKEGVSDRQMMLPFEYKSRVKELSDRYDEIKKNIDELVSQGPDHSVCGETEAELCNEIAAAVKVDLRESGMSREQLVDKLNEFLGRTEEGSAGDEPTCKKPLTINMLNNYLSKPAEYPLPSHLQFALSRIFGSFRVQRVIVEALGGKVISGEDVRRLTLMKMRELKDQIGVMEKMI
jgi:hypothetical protein